MENLNRMISDVDMPELTYVDVGKNSYGAVKRALDILISAVGLAILLIPLLIVGAIIYADDPGAVLFAQYRVGRHGKRFRLYKLRTMRADTPKYLSKRDVEDPDRYITRVGHVLRRLSIDEIPQLWNVLKGDMSLVGPRPLISYEYSIHKMRMRYGVYNIRPGITGLAQINGRDTVTAADKVQWDVKYLREYGWRMDARILLSTIPKIFRCAGVVDGCADERDGTRS